MTQLSREASAAPQPAQQPAAPAPAVRSEPISPVAPVARPVPAAPPAVPPAVVPPRTPASRPRGQRHSRFLNLASWNVRSRRCPRHRCQRHRPPRHRRPRHRRPPAQPTGAARPAVPPVVPPSPPLVPRPPAPPPPPPPSRPAAPAFDWESLVGVKLFSAVAGIALVLAAVLFLRYSIEAGWLQPPVRVAIGILVAIALLVVCELKAARRYPVTANAMDAAAIAILFSTFFAAHALWNLIPSLVAFGLLAMVTADRGAALDQARVALHRGAGPARRLRHAGTPLDRREPSDPALRLPAAAECRARAGGSREAMAGADGPDARPDDHLSVGLGRQVPERQQRAAGDGRLPAVPAGGVCGTHARGARTRGRPRRTTRASSEPRSCRR